MGDVTVPRFRAIQLVPVFAQIAAWRLRHRPANRDPVRRIEVLGASGPATWDAFMDKLRETHLGPAARLTPSPKSRTTRAKGQAAEQKVAHQAFGSFSRRSCHRAGRGGVRDRTTIWTDLAEGLLQTVPPHSLLRMLREEV